MITKIKNIIKKFLRWTERWTKTDMIYLAHGGFWLSAGQIISIISAFALSIAFANLLPKEVYGTYKYVLSIWSILTLSTMGEMGTSLVQSISRGNEGTFYPIVKTRIKWGVVGSLASLGVGLFYLFSDNNNLAAIFFMVAPFVPFMDPLSTYDALLQGKRKFKTSSLNGIVAKISATLIFITTIFLTKNAVIIILSYFLSWTIIRLYFFVVTTRKNRPNTIQDESVKSYGIKLSILKTLTTIGGSASSIFIYNFLGGASLAIFSLAVAPLEQTRAFIGFAENLTMPKFSQDEWRLTTATSFFKKIMPFLIIIIIGIGAYILVAPTLYKIFFPRYLESVVYSQLYATSLIFTAITVIEMSILRAKKMVREITIISVMDILLSFMLTLPMIYFFKIYGMVFSIIFAKLLTTTVMTRLIFHPKSLKPIQ